MAPAPDLLVQHGVALLFAWAFAVQAGLPAPAVPLLLGAGALSGSGHMDLALAIAAAMAAALAADVLWYSLGRAHGARVLGILCRFSLDPDSLIRHATKRFTAHRGRYLIIAKFLPGVNPLAAGLAGMVRIRPDRFVLSAAAGSLLWAGGWITLGYLCADVIGVMASGAVRLGRPLIFATAAALVAYVVYNFARRHRSLRHLRRARITALELRERLDAGDHLVVIDLRTAPDVEAEPFGIPGARLIAPETLDDPHQVIPKNSEVVFYCAEPREATSTRMALRLEAHGYRHVHPLSGGLDAWRRAGFPLEPMMVQPAGAMGHR